MVRRSKSKADEVLDAMAREQKEETEHKIRSREIDSKARLQQEKKTLAGKVKQLEQEVAELQDVAELAAALRANPAKPYKMRRTEKKHGIKEAFAGLLLSDLHFEEIVTPAEVNGLNEYNPEIAIDRCDRLLIGFDWYLQMLRAVYKVRKAYMPLLGDNVTNWLHGTEDSASNFVGPFQALIFARDRIIQLFEGVLASSDLDEIYVPIIPGNHDRMPGTRRNPHRNRTNLSLVLLLADYLERHFKDEPRIRFELSHSAHHYAEIFGHLVRGMHGDGFKYNKGVGGIYVAGRRYIQSLNDTFPAPLTVFGHHHQFKVDSNWLSNGSLIGFSSYAANNGFGFEPAGQVAFALDRDRGKRLPVLLQVQQADSWT